MTTNTYRLNPSELKYPYKTSADRGIIKPGNEDLLAETLGVRLNDDGIPRSGPYGHWGRNAAAVKIFPTIEQANRGIKPILAGALSDPTLYRSQTANSHSETFALLQMYDKLIDTLYPNNKEVPPPREYYMREPLNKRETGLAKSFTKSKIYPQYPRQIIDRFRADPGVFKDLATTNGHRVQAISERIPCAGKEGCANVLNRAIPDGSEVAYFFPLSVDHNTVEQAYNDSLIPWYKSYIQNHLVSSTSNPLPFARDMNREIEERIAAKKNKGRNSFNTPHAALINAQRNSFGIPSPKNTASISKGLVGESNFWSPSDTESYSSGYSSTDDYESNFDLRDHSDLAQFLFGRHLQSPLTTTPSSPLANISSLTNSPITNSPTVSSYGSQLASPYPVTPGFDNTLYNTPIVNQYQEQVARNLNPIPFSLE